jgi:hypothetical protein
MRHEDDRGQFAGAHRARDNLISLAEQLVDELCLAPQTTSVALEESAGQAHAVRL